MARVEAGAPFDPAEAASWMTRGRPPVEAARLASIWRRYPDLPAAAHADDRIQRLRDRAVAMRAFHDALDRRNQQAREIRNFAFTASRIAQGVGDDRDRAILAGRDRHGYRWMPCVRYAEGLMVARGGRAYAPHCTGEEREAYDRGFAEGGGDPGDIFDAARRALRAAVAREIPAEPALARPLPSTWPKPDDARRPTPWSRRLVILGAAEAGLASGAAECPMVLPALLAREGAADTIVLVVAGGVLVDRESCVTASTWPPPPADLPALLAGRDIDDILVAAQGADLAVIDAHASLLPLARHQERLRHTAALQRAQLTLWLDRGLCAGESRAAGHIRWGKINRGLVARLGELTATYTGKDAQGHRIAITLTATGTPAAGYVACDGAELVPAVFVSNRKAVRGAMEGALRRFAGAIRLPASTR